MTAAKIKNWFRLTPGSASSVGVAPPRLLGTTPRVPCRWSTTMPRRYSHQFQPANGHAERECLFPYRSAKPVTVPSQRNKALEQFQRLTCQAGGGVDAVAHLRRGCPDLGLGDMSYRDPVSIRAANTERDDSLLSMVPFLSWMPLCSPT